MAEIVRIAWATGGTDLRARCRAGERSLLLQPAVDSLRLVVTGRGDPTGVTGERAVVEGEDSMAAPAGDAGDAGDGAMAERRDRRS